MAVCNHNGSVPEARITHKRGEWNDVIEKKLKDGDIFFDISRKKGIWTGVQDLESGKVLAVQVAISPGELTDAVNGISSDIDSKIGSLQADITGLRGDLRQIQDDLTEELQGVYKDIDGIRSDIADIQADITGIKKTIESNGSKAIRIAYGTQTSLTDEAIKEYNDDPAKTVILVNYNGIRIPATVSDTVIPFIVAYVPEGLNQRKILYRNGVWSDDTIVYGDTVRYNSQTLTDGQKESARKNIGAVSSGEMEIYVEKKITEDSPIEPVKNKMPDDFTQDEIDALDPDKLYVLKDGNLYTVIGDETKSLKRVGDDGGVWNAVV